MLEKLKEASDPSNASLAISWVGSFATMTLNEIAGLVALALTSFYTLLKCIGWFMDLSEKRRNKTK
jgi:hypothetical protein